MKKSALCQKTEIWNWKKLRIRPNRKTIVYWHLSPQCISSSRPPKMADKVRENKTFFVWIWNEEKIPRKDDFYKTFIYQKQRYIYFEFYFWGTFLEFMTKLFSHNSNGIEFDTCCFTACSLDKSRSINEDKYFNNLGHQAKSFQVFSVPMSSKLFARSFSKMSHLSSSFRISWRCENDAKEEKKRNPIVNTVWKFHNFSITPILREIKFGGSGSAKSAIFCHFWGSEWFFGKFQPSKSAKIHENEDSEIRNVLK